MSQAKALYITNLGLLDNLAKTQILPYLDGLSRKGVSIHILSFEKKEHLEDNGQVGRIKKMLEASRIDWDYLVYHRRWGNVLDVLGGLVKSFRIVKKERVSILHARASIPILIAWPVAKILRRKVIYDRRGTMAGDFVDDVNRVNIFSISIFSFILKTIEKFIIRHSDATIVLSEKALALLKKDKYLSGAETVFESIPCCTDVSRFRGSKVERDAVPDLDGKFVMSYLGSLGTCYLLKEMAQFYKILKRKKSDSVFLIISHTDKGYIEGVLKEEGLEAKVDYMIRSLSPEEVPGYLLYSKCAIMFIKPVECKIGSSPTKFGESLAAGIPCIVNKGIGDTEEIIRRERVGVVVENFDAASYERAVSSILSLLEEEGLADRCVKAACDFFSLDLGIERYANIYERLNAI